jgi:hypothetical protein
LTTQDRNSGFDRKSIQYFKECKMKNIVFYVILISVSVSAFAQTPQTKTTDLQPPAGWAKSGSHPQEYEIFLDSSVHRSGKASGSIKSKPSPAKDGFTTMMQIIKPDNYRGKRIRLAGYLKTENVAGSSSFWLRIDGAEMYKDLGFDNMGNRPVTSTTDWKNYEVVLDVPAEAELIAFGVILQGIGQVWADDLKIEVVGQDVNSTNLTISPEDEAAVQKQIAEDRLQNPAAYEKRTKKWSESKKNSPLAPVNMNFEG